MFTTLERRRLRPPLLLAAAALLLLLCVRLASLGRDGVGEGLNIGPWATRPPPLSSSSWPHHSPVTDGSVIRPPASGSRLIGLWGEITGFAPPTVLRPGGGHPLHLEIASVTTRHRRYFRIDLGGEEASDPSIIPHPHLGDTWIVVAVQHRGAGGGQGDGDDVLQPSAGLMCNARFVDDTLACIGSPTHLPIEPTRGDPARCEGDLEPVGRNAGPRGARVFWGPDRPYLMYASNARLSCLAPWVQDLRGLVPDWAAGPDDTGGGGDGGDFASGTELQRPPPRGPVDRDWFLFWSADGGRYAHFDVHPARSFARLGGDGSAPGGDLAPRVGARDGACLARHLAPLAGDPAAVVRQATNSLAVTLCRRAEPGCAPGADNTFVFALFHHETRLGGGPGGHATYHPYAVLLRDREPFEVWAVGTRPIWISGRRALPGDDTESLRVSSVSWRAGGQRYHGYADDVVFLAFGIEGRAAGGIDVFAGDLLANMGLC